MKIGLFIINQKYPLFFVFQTRQNVPKSRFGLLIFSVTSPILQMKTLPLPQTNTCYTLSRALYSPDFIPVLKTTFYFHEREY